MSSIASRAVAGPVLATLALATLVLALPAPGWAAGDREAGKRKAQACQGCHGMDGIAKVPGAPNLAGQNEQYFIKAMNDFRTGARKNEMMSVLIGQVKREDYADLAAYYASLVPGR